MSLQVESLHPPICSTFQVTAETAPAGRRMINPQKSERMKLILGAQTNE